MSELNDNNRKKKNILDVCSSLSLGNASDKINVDFIGKSNIWVDNSSGSRETISLVRHIIYKAISETAPGQLNVIGYDSELSGLFAPFANLAAGNVNLFELIPDHNSLMNKLYFLKNEIIGTQNVIQGRYDSLYEFRKSVARPIECYKLVILALDFGLLDLKTRNQIGLLMRAGPANGVSFIILSTTMITITASNGKEIELTVDRIDPAIKVLECDGNMVIDVKKGKKVAFTPITPLQITSVCKTMIDDAVNAQLPVVRFDEIKMHDSGKMWTGSSAEGITFCVGKYGMNDMEITIGDEFNQRHNVLITGAVGQGKSNLISMIIHSICVKYSPSEVQLYLLDFKEGVTFKAFSNIGQPEYLPHAKVLGLESDVSFGLAVLKDLAKEYKRRIKIFKECNCKSIQEYRLKNPKEKLPRIVAIIDEFQMMFGEDNDKNGAEVADTLEKSVRLFRAVGIHFVLASQSLTGNPTFNMKKNIIFSQFPIRIGLKNSKTESNATFQTGNEAAAYLRPRESIVNLDYGDINQNCKTVIGFADEKVLKPYRKIWWEQCRKDFKPPFVFESERRVTISSGIDEIWTYREASSVPRAFISQNISISGRSVSIPMTSEPGRNIAILGSTDEDCNNADGILQSIAVSLALQNTDGKASFWFYDFANTNTVYEELWPNFAATLENCGYFVESKNPENFQDDIENLSKQVNKDPIYIFGSSMDRWEPKNTSGGFGLSMSSPLQTLTMEGPAKNIHFFGWWIKADNFKKQVAGISANASSFNTKIFLRIDGRTVTSYSNPNTKWSPKTNRALVVDDVEFVDPIEVIPYSPLKKEDVSLFR